MEQGYSFQQAQSAIRSKAPYSPFPFHQINIEGVGDSINTLQHIPIGTVLFFKDQKTKEGYKINGTYRFDSIYRNVLTFTKYPPRDYDFGIINQVEILGTMRTADYRKTSNLEYKVRLKDLDLHSQAIHAIPPMGVLPIGTCITFTEGLLDSDLSDPNPVCELFQKVYKTNTFGKSLIGEWVVVANAGVTGAGLINRKKNDGDLNATLQRHFGQSYMLRKIKNIEHDEYGNIIAIGRYAPNEKNSIELRAEHLHELLIRSTHLKSYKPPTGDMEKGTMEGIDVKVEELLERFDYITKDAPTLANEYFNICTKLNTIYNGFFSVDRFGGQVYISQPFVINRDTLLENEFACGLESLLTMTGYQTGDGAKVSRSYAGNQYDTYYWGGAMNQWRFDGIDPYMTSNVSLFTLPISQHEPHKSNEILNDRGRRTYVWHSFDYMDNGETKAFYEKKPSEDGFEPLESLFPDDKGCVNYCLSVNSSIFHPFENTLANIPTIDETSITGGSFKLKRQSIQYPILWFIQRWLYSAPSVGGAKWAAYQKSPLYLRLMLSGDNPYELNKNCRAETPQDVLSIKEIDCPPLSLVGIINAQQVKMYGVVEEEFSESPNQIYSMIAKSRLKGD